MHDPISPLTAEDMLRVAISSVASTPFSTKNVRRSDRWHAKLIQGQADRSNYAATSKIYEFAVLFRMARRQRRNSESVFRRFTCADRRDARSLSSGATARPGGYRALPCYSVAKHQPTTSIE